MSTACAPRAVTMIPPKISKFPVNALSCEARKRVAAYARVSTDTDEQLTSYEAQVDYYTRHIQSNDQWDFVEVYTDEGISATSTKKRDGFNRMIADALSGKIDLIITKSVSRFARNTVDSLTTVRKLKEHGVEIYFEKENIYTLDSKGELLITIMSSLAQEESRSISENVTWGQRKRFADGKVNLPYKQFLGYEKGADGLPKIVEKQALIVRLIYKLFLEGKAPSAIAKQLTISGIPTPSGKQKWQSSTVESILQNEKYKGDAILQKSFTVDFLTKKKKINEGEVPQYYVENSHPAIIPPETFDLVQYEIKRRKELGQYTSSANCFSSRIICAECGGFYGSKHWHPGTKYQQVVWQCNSKAKNHEKYTAVSYKEADLKNAFVAAFNSLIDNRQEILRQYTEVISLLTDTTELDTKATELQGECDVLLELLRKCVADNAAAPLDQAEYEQRYTNLATRYDTAKTALSKVTERQQTRRVKRKQMELFLEKLQQQENLLAEFDEATWYATVESITAHSAHEIIFRFKNGAELPWQI